MAKKKRAQRKASGRKNPQTGIGDAVRANWPLIKIYLLFGAVLLAFFTVIMIKPVYFGVILPFNDFLAWSSLKATPVRKHACCRFRHDHLAAGIFN